MPPVSQGSETRAAFILPIITPRSEEDHILFDAMKHYLIDMPLEQILHQVKSIVDISMMLYASPVLVFALYRLIMFKGFEIEDRFAGQPVKTILTDVVYSEEYFEYMAFNMGSNDSNKETNEHVQRPTLPMAIGSIENIPRTKV